MAAVDPPVAIVTGANIGIGYEAALELVALGYTTVVASRSAQRGQAAVDAMISDLERLGRLPANGAKPVFMKLDLADFSSVTQFALDVRNQFPRVHALVLNAGMNVAVGETLEQRTTRDGFEICMQVSDSRRQHHQIAIFLKSRPSESGTLRHNPIAARCRSHSLQANYLGHALLTDLLLPLLTRTAASGSIPGVPVRLVPLASLVHRVVSKEEVADWPGLFKAFGAYTYNKSKVAAVILSQHITRLLAALQTAQQRKRSVVEAQADAQAQQAQLSSAAGQVESISVNPGAVLSNIWRHWPTPARQIARPLMALAFLSPAQGAAPVVAAAAAHTLRDGASANHTLRSGDYLVPYHVLSHSEPLATACEVMGPFAGPQVAMPNPIANDPEVGEALWRATREAVAPWVARYKAEAASRTARGSWGVSHPAAAAGAAIADLDPNLDLDLPFSEQVEKILAEYSI